MFRIIIIAAFALAACAPKAEVVTPDATQKATTPMNGSVPAPTPAGVTQSIIAADNGRTIVVPPGGRFSVELVGVPTAGYIWSVVEKPAFLSDAVETGGNTTKAQSQPGFTGGNHWEVFTFQTSAAGGEGTLKLEQRRPWEKTEPANQTFTVTIQSR